MCAHLSDHDAGEVAMLEGSVDWVPLGEGGSQLQVQFVQLVHLLQSELCLVGPVCGNIPGGRRGGRSRRWKTQRGREGEGRR